MVNKMLNKIIKRFNKSSKLSEPVFFTKDIFKYKKYDIGEYTYGKPRVLFDGSNANLKIGKFSSIADNVTIFLGGNHRTDWITTYPFSDLNGYFPFAKDIKGHPATKGDVTIGSDVWIGNNTIIMSGITIGDGAVIAAGSVIAKSIGNYEVWGGNPAKLLKLRFDQEKIQFLKNLKWWDWDISTIEKNMHILCSSNIDKLKR